MIDLVIGNTVIPSMVRWARDNDMILHLRQAGHSTNTRQRSHGVSFRMIAKWMRLAGSDHLHAGIVLGKLKDDPATTERYYDIFREERNLMVLENGIFFDQGWACMKKMISGARSATHTA